MAEPLDDAILQFVLAANNYGSGPGYMSANDNPYQRSDQRLNFMTDILRSSGLYIDDLLGLGEAPEMPDPASAPTAPMAPVGGFQSDLRDAYRGSPLIAEAFAEIEAGADPFAVTQGLMAEVQANPELASSLPAFQQNNEFQSPFPGGTDAGPTMETSMGSLQELLTQFAEEVARERREGGVQSQEYNQALQEYAQQQAQYQGQVDEYNQYFQPTTGLQEQGYQTEEDYLRDFMSRNRVNEANPRGFAQPTAGQAVPDSVMSMLPAGLSNRLTQGQAARSGVDSVGSTPRQSVDERTRQFMSQLAPQYQQQMSAQMPVSGAGTSAAGRHRSRVAANTRRPQSGQNAGNDFVNSRIQQIGQRNAGDLASRSTPSQAEQDNRKRLQAVYTLLFGENL